MNTKSYKIIFALLSFSLLVVLLLQAFWIKNFYTQKQEEFNRIVYQVLSDISNKLNERENINFIKESAVPKTKITKTGKQVKVITSSTSKNTANSISDVDIFRELKMDTVFKENQHIIISDSVMRINNHHQTIIINNKVSKNIPKKEDINKLLDKMLMEIKTIDVSPIEDIHKDTLHDMMTREFESRGIFIPFEFSLRKEDAHTDKILAQSDGYKTNNKKYKADLSNKKVFRNNNYLYLQFPDEADFVFSSIKNMLILSLAFSLVIITVFYFTLKTILQQKKLSEVKNDFINNMTHELKTPIATISLAIDAINNNQVKSDEEKFKTYTSILKEENQKLNNHVERVLQMAMIDKGDLHLNKQEIDLVKIINSAIHTHKLQIEKQKAEVIFIHKLAEVYIVADELHLLTVFNNLMDNALKYSDKNCLIEIKLDLTIKNAIITIKDNGIGIEHSVQKKIFDKFYRVQSGNIHDVKGFGLGLSYVKSIIESHHGIITLNSEKGKGSEFEIKLPVNES